MKRIFSIGLLFIFLAGFSGAALQAETPLDKIKFPPLNKQEMPKIDKTVLENGLTVYLLEDHELPVINAVARLGAGEYLVPDEKVGLGNLTAAVMRTGGTDKLTGDQVDSVLEGVGGSIELSMRSTNGTANMNILSDYSDLGLSLLAGIFRHPAFAQDKIDLEKTSQRSAISRRNDEAMDICIRQFRKIIYGKDSPYARHTEYSTIDNVTRDDLVAFHDKYITPENVMLAVWGDFNRDAMLAKIKKYFGDWPKGSGRVPDLPKVTYDFKPGVHYVQKDNINQTKMMIGHIGGYLSDPDYFAMVVMNNILGGSFGSRLFNDVRSKQGLAYAVGGSYTSNIAYPGIYYNYCYTKSETTVKAVKSIINEIKMMQTNPPTPEELKTGKDSYLNSFVFNFEDKGDIITRMMEYDYFGFPNDFLYKEKENIEKVTAQDVMAVAQKRLHPEALQIVVVGKGADFDESLSVLGTVDTMDVTIPTGEKKEAVEATPEAESKGKELLGLAVNACGGLENFKKINSVSEKGSLTVTTPQGEMSLKTTTYELLPDRSRQEIVTPMGSMVTVRSGDKAWMLQGERSIPLPDEQVAEAKKSEFRNTLLLFKTFDNPTYKIVYIGPDKLNDKAVNMIQIASLDGQMTFKLALDAATNLPLAKMYFGQSASGPGDMAEILSDYREVGGIKVPYFTRVESNGQKLMSMSLTECLINPAIPDSLFINPQK